MLAATPFFSSMETNHEGLINSPILKYLGRNGATHIGMQVGAKISGRKYTRHYVPKVPQFL
jgi:hypothetical protein